MSTLASAVVTAAGLELTEWNGWTDRCSTEGCCCRTIDRSVVENVSMLKSCLGVVWEFGWVMLVVGCSLRACSGMCCATDSSCCWGLCKWLSLAGDWATCSTTWVWDEMIGPLGDEWPSVTCPAECAAGGSCGTGWDEVPGSFVGACAVGCVGTGSCRAAWDEVVASLDCDCPSAFTFLDERFVCTSGRAGSCCSVFGEVWVDEVELAHNANVLEAAWNVRENCAW